MKTYPKQSKKQKVYKIKVYKLSINEDYYIKYITCFGEESEAKGQTGQFQSSTEREAKVTAIIAWIVETTLLQNSNERFGHVFLINTKSVDHEITPKATIFLILSSMIFAILLLYTLKRSQ